MILNAQCARTCLNNFKLEYPHKISCLVYYKRHLNIFTITDAVILPITKEQLFDFFWSYTLYKLPCCFLQKYLVWVRITLSSIESAQKIYGLNEITGISHYFTSIDSSIGYYGPVCNAILLVAMQIWLLKSQNSATSQ